MSNSSRVQARDDGGGSVDNDGVDIISHSNYGDDSVVDDGEHGDSSTASNSVKSSVFSSSSSALSRLLHFPNKQTNKTKAKKDRLIVYELNPSYSSVSQKSIEKSSSSKKQRKVDVNAEAKEGTDFWADYYAELDSTKLEDATSEWENDIKLDERQKRAGYNSYHISFCFK
jgi:hypothetical protein